MDTTSDGASRPAIPVSIPHRVDLQHTDHSRPKQLPKPGARTKIPGIGQMPSMSLTILMSIFLLFVMCFYVYPVMRPFFSVIEYLFSLLGSAFVTSSRLAGHLPGLVRFPSGTVAIPGFLCVLPVMSRTASCSKPRVVRDASYQWQFDQPLLRLSGILDNSVLTYDLSEVIGHVHTNLTELESSNPWSRTEFDYVIQDAVLSEVLLVRYDRETDIALDYFLCSSSDLSATMQRSIEVELNMNPLDRWSST